MNNSNNNNNKSQESIGSFYEGKTVFLTGATGFVGRFLVYKLCKDVNVSRIYFVLRSKSDKKGNFKSVKEREAEFKKLELFQFLPDKSSLNKVIALEGDVNLPMLGLNDETLNTIYKQVNIVIHSAATVRFTEDLKVSAKLHINGTQNIINVAKNIKNLDIFVHLSSFSVWSANDVLTETIPESPYDPYEFASMFDKLTDEQAKKLEPQYLGKPPKYLNSYALTKSLAEVVVKDNAHLFKKVAILRPPFLMSPAKDPEIGWFDEPQTGAGLGALFSLGLLRMANLRLDYPIELIPVDLCVNAILGIAWFMCRREEKKLLVFNMPSSRDAPWTGREMFGYGIAMGYKYPSIKQIRPPVEQYHFVPSRAYVAIKAFFTHTLFSLMIDFLLILTGQKPLLYKLTSRLVNAVRQIFETMNDYKDELKYEVGNIDLLYGPDGHLPQGDKEVFGYDLKNVAWIKLGIANHIRFRRHILKEPDSNLDYARRRMKVIDVGYRIFKVAFQLFLVLAIYQIHLTLLHSPLLWWPFAAIVTVLTAIMIIQ